MRKYGNIMLLGGMVVIIISALFMSFHLRAIGRPLTITGLVVCNVGLLIRIFTPVTATRWQNFSEQFYRWHSLSHKLVDIGGLLLSVGLLGKMYHVEGIYLLIQIGIVGYVAGLVSLYILFKIKNKYIIDSELDKVLSNDDLEKYTGLYKNEELKMDISVTVADGYLVGQATGQGPYRLSAVKEHIFNHLPAKLVMEFHPDQNEFILIQNGGYFPFAKIK